MAPIEQLIQQSLNPFDNFAARNFWEDQKLVPTVESIHQEALTQIKEVLDAVVRDRETRTLILYGDSGSGKTHFLGRLKQTLNDRAFFAYIEPFPQSEHIWRHILRYTVDSLVNAPTGRTDSQLILWLKSCLSAIQDGLPIDGQNLVAKIQGFFGQSKSNVSSGSDRKFFIDILRKNFGSKGFYNANEFFGVLYHLTNPDLHFLACDWLKGDDLDEEDLKKLRVAQSIDNEDKARGILSNFSKISAKTQPIVLCFDNLDSIARLPDGAIDIQALFSVTSAIYNANWPGLLIIVSVITSTWNDNYKRVQPADLHRITSKVPLKRITLAEAEALLSTRLAGLHEQAQPKPNSPIYPVTQQDLKQEFPSGKALTRNVLMLGQQIFQKYKQVVVSPTEDILASFKLLWQDELKKTREKITKISLLSAPELIRMLAEALAALQVKEIKLKLLSGNFASYSLSYQQLDKGERVGVVWTEDSNMKSFHAVMNACQGVINKNSCEALYLIRSATVGKPQNVGNQIYRQIFTGSLHRHIKPILSSVQYLAVYHNLVKAALANELVVTGKTVDLKELEALIRQSEVLNNCNLLQDLNIVRKSSETTEPEPEFKEFLMDVVKSQGYMGKDTLVENTLREFSQLDRSQIEEQIQRLIQEKKIQLVNPNAPSQERLVCFVP